MDFKNWLEMDLGGELHKSKGIWMVAFNAIKNDPVEGWVFDWNEAGQRSSISDVNQVSVGDKVADYALNMTPYWQVSGVDPDKGLVYLDPIEPNPFLTGVGAGGKKLGKWDYEVQSGDYETKRVEEILAGWKAGKVQRLGDIAYLLSGTVPVHMGPNGSQGGWYASRDTRSNRGGQKGMSSEDIVKQDAATAKNTFGFDVPASALDGTLDPHTWDDFINGQVTPRDRESTRLEGEDFNDVKAMAKMVIDHKMPSIKMRNADALMDYFQGRDKYDTTGEDWETQRDAYIRGDYRRQELEPLIKSVARKLHTQTNLKKDEHDPYYLVKEKFILTAGAFGWDNILRMYEDSVDKDNRRYVYNIYAGKTRGAYEGKTDEDAMFRMLGNETQADTIMDMIGYIERKEPIKTHEWVMKNMKKLQKIAAGSKWYGEKLKGYIDHVARIQGGGDALTHEQKARRRMSDALEKRKREGR